MDDGEIIQKVLSRNPRKIFSKAENYALYEAGLFGNKALTWSSYGEILGSGWNGGVCMRSKKGVARKEVRYDLKLDDVPEHIEYFKKIGIPENMISFNQSMPNKHLVLQGEIMNSSGGFYFFGSTIKKPMNLALEEKSFIVEGDAAESALEQKLFWQSYRDLKSLLETYPESVVEFSAYSVPVGNLPERNAVFWEVRNY